MYGGRRSRRRCMSGRTWLHGRRCFGSALAESVCEARISSLLRSQSKQVSWNTRRRLELPTICNPTEIQNAGKWKEIKANKKFLSRFPQKFLWNGPFHMNFKEIILCSKEPQGLFLKLVHLFYTIDYFELRDPASATADVNRVEKRQCTCKIPCGREMYSAEWSCVMTELCIMKGNNCFALSK